jgi:hypothetical protein
MHLHSAEAMAAPIPPDAKIVALLKTLNDLIAEAQYLREDIERTARERQHPVWPERWDQARRFREVALMNEDQGAMQSTLIDAGLRHRPTSQLQR